MELTKHLSNNLIAIRRIRGLSQSSFAQELGIARSTLHDMESGRPPNLETLDLLSRQLEIPAGVLISSDLSMAQLDVLHHLLRALNWYVRWETEDQDRFALLCGQMLVLIRKYT